MKRNSKTWERKLKRLAVRTAKLAGAFDSEELAEIASQLQAIAKHPLDHSKVLAKKATKGTFLEGAVPLNGGTPTEPSS